MQANMVHRYSTLKVKVTTLFCKHPQYVTTTPMMRMENLAIPLLQNDCKQHRHEIEEQTRFVEYIIQQTLHNEFLNNGKTMPWCWQGELEAELIKKLSDDILTQA